MQFFKWEHLPAEKQRFSKPFGQLAESICEAITTREEIDFDVDEFMNDLSISDNIETREAKSKLGGMSELLDELNLNFDTGHDAIKVASSLLRFHQKEKQNNFAKFFFLYNIK